MFVKKTVAAIVFSLISGTSIASSQVEMPLMHGSQYNNKPLYFGGQVFKQFEVNLIFKTAYQNKFKNPSDKVADTVQISDKYVALLVISKGAKHIVFTDGSDFFTAENSPTKLINHKLEQQLLNAYNTNYVQDKEDESVSVIHKVLDKIKKQKETQNKPAQSSPKTPVDLKQSEKVSENTFDVFFHKNINTVTPYYLIPEVKNLPKIYVFVSSHCGYCKKLIGQYKSHPEAYAGMNVAFIPIGNPKDVTNGKWKEFFGVQPANLTAENIIKNNDFFDGSTKANKEPGYATPSFIWNSKQKGKMIKANGLISIQNMKLVKEDLH